MNKVGQSGMEAMIMHNLNLSS